MKKIKFLTLIIALIIGQSAMAKCVVCFNYPTTGWECVWCEELDCGAGRPAGYSFNNLIYCKQYMLVPNKPPIIRTEKAGSAYLENDGKIIKIASDKAVIFFSKNIDHTQKEIDEFFKTDDGIVSQKRIDAIAKELNAKIVKSSTPITANYCPACDEETKKSQIQGCPGGYEMKDGWCQKIVYPTPDKVTQSPTTTGTKSIECPKGSYEKNGECIPWPIKESAAMIYLGGTGSFGIGKTKSEFQVPNLGGVQADIYVPFVRKSIITFGINVSGNYTLSSKNPFNKVSVEPFHIINETSTTVATTTSSSQKNQAFQFAAGPQLNIHVGKHFMVSPIFNVGYMNLSQNDFSAIQTSQVNGTTYNLNLLTQSQTSVSSLLLAPKLRLHYFINDWIGLWIDGAFNYSNSLKSTITKFTPSTGPDANGLYDESAIIEGTETTETIKSSFNAVGISGGLVFAIGSKHKSKIDGDGTKAVGGNPTSIEKPTYTQNQEPGKPTEIYEPPIITTPHNNEVVTLSENTLYIDYKPSTACNVKYKVMVWKNENGKQKQIYDKTHPRTFSGKIDGLKLNDKEINKLTIKMQAIPCEACGNCKGDKQTFQNASNTVIKNGGNSNVVNVTTTTGCGALFEINIDSARCEDDNKKIRVFVNAIFTPQTVGLTGTLTIDDLKIDNNSIALPSDLSSINPKTVSAGNNYFSFTIDGNLCKKSLSLNGTLHYTCPGLAPATIPCGSSIDALPCCYCKYCDDKIIKSIDSTSTVSSTANILQIHQAFTLNPVNITKISAEIIYMSEDTTIDKACKTCAKDENEVFHFIDNNTANWTTTGATSNAIASNSGQTYPSKAIEFTSNNHGNVTMDLNIALPGISKLTCCKHKGQVCIRYYFTDINCKTCEYFICYNYESNN